MILDFTCCDTLCSSYVKNFAKRAGSAAELREDQKSKHYQDLTNYHFAPIATETYGSWGPQGENIIKEIGKKVQEEATPLLNIEITLEGLPCSISTNF